MHMLCWGTWTTNSMINLTLHNNVQFLFDEKA